MVQGFERPVVLFEATKSAVLFSTRMANMDMDQHFLMDVAKASALKLNPDVVDEAGKCRQLITIPPKAAQMRLVLRDLLNIISGKTVIY
jgi:hypothetical protein